MTTPTSVNAATGPAGDVATGQVATPAGAATDSGTSILSTIMSGLAAVTKFSADDIAKALGVYFAARAAISTVASGVAQIVTQKTLQGVQAQYTDVPLTPAVLADAVIRNLLVGGTGVTAGTSASGTAPLLGNVDGNTAAQEAALSGLDTQRFNLLVQATGESYGVIDALRLYNRGQSMTALVKGPNYATGTPLYVAGESLATTYGITSDELNTVIAYSRIRDQFIPDLLKLAKNTLSPADAVELAVKQVVPDADAQALFEAAGGVGEQFEALVDAAGDSAGIEKAVELAAHGVIGIGQLNQILGLSRLNPRFYYLAHNADNGTFPLNSKWLGPYEIGESIANGTMSTADGLTALEQSGYSTEQAAAFTSARATGAVAKPKEETAAMVLNEYTAKLITEADATTALANLGYTTTAIPFLLEQATARAIIAARNAAIARVKSAYLMGDITATQAQTELGTLGIPQAAITDFMTDWGVEAATPHMHLSAAEIGWFVEHAVITPDQGVAMWQSSGFTAGTAQLLLKRYPPPAPPPAAAPAPLVSGTPL